MIPPQEKPIIARWIADEASLLGEEIIWQDEWRGFYKATRRVGDITFVMEFTAVSYPKSDATETPERAVRTEP